MKRSDFLRAAVAAPLAGQGIVGRMVARRPSCGAPTDGDNCSYCDSQMEPSTPTPPKGGGPVMARLGSTVYFTFSARSFDTGIPTALLHPSARALDTADLDGPMLQGVTVTRMAALPVTNVEAVASAANGYQVGREYVVVLTEGIVDNVSVAGEVVGEFRVVEP